MMGVGDHEVTNSAYGWIPVKPEGFDGRLSLMSVAFLLKSSGNAVVWVRGNDCFLVSLRTTFAKLESLAGTKEACNDSLLSTRRLLEQVGFFDCRYSTRNFR